MELQQQCITDGLTYLLTKHREAIDQESQRFVMVGDAEALHDLRVSLRRLHSLFIAFKPAFIAHADFPLLLHQLLKQTNHARDLEVSLGILRNSQIVLPWLEQQWQAELEKEYTRLRQFLPDTWQRISPELDSHLTLFSTELPAQKLGTLTASLLRKKSKKLYKQRKSLCTVWNNKQAHALRITGKQIRYLLEPFSDDSDTARAVKNLKRFQDMLGEYHDVVVLRKKLKQLMKDGATGSNDALKSARHHLRKHRKKLRQQILRKYCASKGKQLDDSLAQSALALA